MPFLVSVNTESLRGLMNGWINSSKYQRHLPEGIIIDKLSARNIILSDSEESIHLLMDLKGRHPNDVTVYKMKVGALVFCSRRGTPVLACAHNYCTYAVPKEKTHKKMGSLWSERDYKGRDYGF